MAFGQGASVLELLADREALERELGLVKGRLTQLNERIAEAVKQPMESAFAREGKPDGTVKFALDNHIFKAVVDKRVEWNSDALADIARELGPDGTAELLKVKTTYSMSEPIFKTIQNPELRAKLTIARTVKYGEPKITAAD